MSYKVRFDNRPLWEPYTLGVYGSKIFYMISISFSSGGRDSKGIHGQRKVG